MKAVLRIAVMLCAVRAFGQLTSDTVQAGRTIPVDQQIRNEMEESRFHFGGLRVHPLFTLRELGYSNIAIGTSSAAQVIDWGATAGAGVRIIAPLAPRVYFRTSLVPEYTWSLRVPERRTFGGQYEAEVLALLNRVALEARVNPSRTLARVSSEDETPVVTSSLEGLGRLEVQIFRRLSVFAENQIRRPRFSSRSLAASASNLALLERNDSAVRSGVHYRFSSSFDIAAGVEETTTKFVRDSSRDNDTHAVILNLRYDRPRTYASIKASSRKGEARGDRFQNFSTNTGSYAITRQLAVPVVVDLTGRRAITYSLFQANAYFIETRNGAGIAFPLGRRGALRVFGETGNNDYPVALAVGGGATLKRRDKATTYGGGIALNLIRNVVFSTVVSNTKYNSNVAGFDRSTLTVSSNLVLSVTGHLLPEYIHR